MVKLVVPALRLFRTLAAVPNTDAAARVVLASSILRRLSLLLLIAFGLSAHDALLSRMTQRNPRWLATYLPPPHGGQRDGSGGSNLVRRDAIRL